MSSSHFYRFSVMVMLLTAGALFAEGPADKAGIKIRGTLVRDISRSSCGKNTKKEAELVLDRVLLDKYDDFRIMKAPAGARDKPEELKCPKTIADNQAKVEKLSSDDLKFHEGFLLSDGQCKKQGGAGTNLLCVYPGDSGATDGIAEVRYTFDTTAALINNIKDRAAINGVIQFSIETTGKVSQVEICYGKRSDGTDDQIIDANDNCNTAMKFKSTKENPPRITVKGLDNNIDYVLRIRPLDASGAPGEWGPVEKFKPIPVVFPLELYDGAGNPMVEWSCQTSSGTSLGLISAIALIMLLLRKRALKSSLLLSVFILTLSLLPSYDARAEFGQVDISILGSMYRPDLDNEKLGSGAVTPFYKYGFRKNTSDTDGPILPFMGFEADMHLFDGFGSLQLGLGAGYAWPQGHPIELDAAGKPDFSKPMKSVMTTLHVYQLRPQLTYLFDYAKEYFPLVPYVRGAFILHGYSFTQSIESNSTPRSKPHGLMFGFQGAAGMRFYFSFLERGAVRSARGSGFFQDVFLKAELSYTQVDSFQKTGFNFSAKDVMGSGLPLMWTFGLGFELP